MCINETEYVSMIYQWKFQTPLHKLCPDFTSSCAILFMLYYINFIVQLQLFCWILWQGNWNASLAFVVGNQIEDYAHINALVAAVKGGTRKLFSSLSREELFSQVGS